MFFSNSVKDPNIFCYSAIVPAIHLSWLDQLEGSCERSWDLGCMILAVSLNLSCAKIVVLLQIVVNEWKDNKPFEKGALCSDNCRWSSWDLNCPKLEMSIHPM